MVLKISLAAGCEPYSLGLCIGHLKAYEYIVASEPSQPREAPGQHVNTSRRAAYRERQRPPHSWALPEAGKLRVLALSRFKIEDLEYLLEAD